MSTSAYFILRTQNKIAKDTFDANDRDTMALQQQQQELISISNISIFFRKQHLVLSKGVTFLTFEVCAKRSAGRLVFSFWTAGMGFFLTMELIQKQEVLGKRLKPVHT